MLSWSSKPMWRWTSSMPKCWLLVCYGDDSARKYCLRPQRSQKWRKRRHSSLRMKNPYLPIVSVRYISSWVADSLNKFKSKKNYFQGEAHSLRSSVNSIRSSGSSPRSPADTLQHSNSSLRSSGFSLRSSSNTQSSTTGGGLRRSEQGLRQSASENRFEEIDKENRFKGVGHKLKWGGLFVGKRKAKRERIEHHRTAWKKKKERIAQF